MMHKRILSLDVFRGASIAGMILVNTFEDNSIKQLQHAPWHGFTFADSIFPFFLWISGVSIVFAFKRHLEEGTSKSKIIIQVIKRSLILFVLGILLYSFPFYDFQTIRILGVLQRIAICYLVVSTIFLFTKIRMQAIFTAILLLGYWLILKYVPVPGVGRGVLEMNGNIVQYVDLTFLRGHLWSPMWDPEGILSTLGAIATMFFGVLAGQTLFAKESSIKRVMELFVSGIALMALGLIMNIWLPINKNLWTSSYVVFTAGLSSFVFAVLYFIVELKKYIQWAHPLVIYGENPITIYALSIIVAKSLMLINFHDNSLWEHMHKIMFATIKNNTMVELLFAFFYLVFLYAVAYVMYKRQWFIKI